MRVCVCVYTYFSCYRGRVCISSKPRSGSRRDEHEPIEGVQKTQTSWSMWLTFGLWDGAADGGAGGGDRAHGGAHAVGRVHPCHGRSVGHPGCWVDGPDGLAWKEGGEGGVRVAFKGLKLRLLVSTMKITNHLIQHIYNCNKQIVSA